MQAQHLVRCAPSYNLFDANWFLRLGARVEGEEERWHQRGARAKSWQTKLRGRRDWQTDTVRAGLNSSRYTECCTKLSPTPHLPAGVSFS